MTHMLAINARLSEYDEVLAIAEANDMIWASVGSHPHEAEAEETITTADLIAKSNHPKVVGIGETGLDYFYDNAPRDMQRENFRKHITAARETGLPIIIHSREADNDTIEILSEEMGKGAFSGVIHCFTSTQRLADACLDMGFYISLSGIVTFKSAVALQETAKTIPLERLLVETDSPFLAPVPHRGKRCEPAFTADTVRFLSDLTGDTPEDITAMTTANFFDLFTEANTQ